ncbi:hypothetical protein [Conexibacter arvalis]|uniref:Nucleotidyltransferase family protein n=1 Tax=Conexibacter arvalis TaxID=912552 RepID=A0A840IDZ7_9ACTN|nr:hypothetical protein [Conexibacter arvalis]MBB4662248.1 hypothetical protein [Conexibacter arvalis]
MTEIERPAGPPGEAFERMAAEARALVAAGAAAGVPLRAVGGIGVWERLAPARRDAYARMRPAPKDLDLIAPPGTKAEVAELFAARGYVADERLIAWHGDRRHRYFLFEAGGEEPALEVDVFLGLPPACHRLELRDALDADGVAASATDLLLQKLQIVETTDKDLVDILYLLLGHELSPTDAGDGLDAGHVARLLARDWGFHHTASGNVEKVRALVPDAGLNGETAATGERLERLAAAIEAEPKTRRWKLRAKVGTRAQWYEDVEELDR